jgi:hypothetical protein
VDVRVAGVISVQKITSLCVFVADVVVFIAACVSALAATSIINAWRVMHLITTYAITMICLLLVTTALQRVTQETGVIFRSAVVEMVEILQFLVVDVVITLLLVQLSYIKIQTMEEILALGIG